MLISVILHGTRVLRDRYRHFVRVRRDLKLAVNNHKLNVREVRVGVLEVFRFNAYRIFANVRSLGRPRIGRRFLHAGCYVVQRVVSRHALVARNRMFLAVILRGARALRNRHNHFVRDRRDFQLAFGRGNRVVDRLRIAVQLVGERVLALANVRLRARHLVRRALAFNKAVAAYRHRVVRQRRAVVLFAVSSGGQRHFALADRQRSRIRLRNDILFCSVYRVNRTIRKRCRICSDIRSLRANVDRAEIRAFRRTGKAGNFLLLSIIRHRVAVRRQLDVLIIV